MGASDMKKIFALLLIAAMWGCTDYVGQWDDQYGTAFTGNSAPTNVLVCEEMATTAVTDENNCVMSFLCMNNAWVPQDYVCNNVQQQRICDEGVGTSVVNGSCITNFLCLNNAWVVYGEPICTTPTVPSSSSKNTTVKSSNSVAKSSSSKAKSSSSVVRASSSSVKRSNAFPTWLGRDGLTRVDTRLDAGMDDSGYWYTYTDDADGGKSEVIWPVPIGNEYSDLALDNVVLHCGGICGTALLDRGTLVYEPFVGIAFDVAGHKGNSLAAADASAWGGVCITYKSDYSATLQLGLGDYDTQIEYAVPSVSLAKASAGTMRNIAWSAFKQPAWYKGSATIDGTAAAKRLVTLKFQIQGSSGSSYGFNICAIGPYNGACPSTCN